MARKNLGDFIAQGTLWGIGGWVLENAIGDRDKYSSVFRGARVPFLPIYAATGLALTSAAPFVAQWPTLARAFSYAIVGSIIEYAGCKIDRNLLSSRSWDYGQNDALARASDGCLNLTHSALWGGLGLIAEKFT